MKNGKHIPEAMEKINWVLRDWRKDEPTEMDPDLIDLVWEIHSELGSAEPIHIISGYRSRDTNDMLRRTVGGQASQSRHILGKAMDVHFPDVPVKKLRYSALIRERGGVGYYPTSATPFVHIDTDRVRAWPRAAAHGAGLLFPSGRTQHQPTDGRVDHARGRAPGARRRHRACHADRRVPPAARASEAADSGRLAGPRCRSSCRCRRLVERPRRGTRPTDASARGWRPWRTSRCRLVGDPMPVSRQRPAADVPRSGEMRLPQPIRAPPGRIA